jgi:hypothetical protein
MPRFHLTFDYPDRLGAKAVARHTVTAETIEDAAEYAAAQRSGLPWIHIRTSNGETVNRLFTFSPSERVA